MSNRAWFRIHSFAGVVTGLMLFVICWSGTFAVLSHEIDWLVTPEARADEGEGRASWGEIEAAVAAAFPSAEIRWLSAPLYRASTAQAVVDLPAQRAMRVYVDPYTAEVRGVSSYFTVQRFFRSFHMNLFLKRFGYYTVMAFALTMLTSLVAALVFYKRWWRRFLVRPRGRGKAFWSTLHKTVGLWSIWFLLVIGVTGGWYLFEMLRVDVGDGKVAYAGTGDFAVNRIPPAASDPSLPVQPLDALVDRVRHLRPDLEMAVIGFRGENRAVLYVDGQAAHLLVRDRANQVHLDRRNGEVSYNQTPHDYSLYWRWSDTADPLHFGDFGRLWSKGVWFVFGLVLSGLILTGVWLHAHRLARETAARARSRWPGAGAAVLVTLAVLAASAAGGIAELRNYGSTIDGVRKFPEIAPGVAATIIGWILATLAIIFAWVFLLWRPETLLRISSALARRRSGGVG